MKANYKKYCDRWYDQRVLHQSKRRNIRRILQRILINYLQRNDDWNGF